MTTRQPMFDKKNIVVTPKQILANCYGAGRLQLRK